MKTQFQSDQTVSYILLARDRARGGCFWKRIIVLLQKRILGNNIKKNPARSNLGFYLNS
jgi:hypothetical protein